MQIAGRAILANGKLVKVAAVRDEELVEGDVIPDPDAFISELKRSCLKADVFTFPQRIDEPTPKYPYFFEWDNVAVAFTNDFRTWWESLPQEARKNARRAAKRGLVVRVVPFEDEFVRGIKEIYDETPVRQGMRFWHFGKDFETVKMENGTYIDRSEFIGAYLDGELIGFIKLVYVDKSARILQILSKAAHYDKRPMNALIAKTVEVCSQKGISYLVYSKFTFGNKRTSPLREFKRRNGFREVLFPRYYVPLTLKGSLAMKLNLHRDVIAILPSGLIDVLLNIRSKFLRMTSGGLTHPTSPHLTSEIVSPAGVRQGPRGA